MTDPKDLTPDLTDLRRRAEARIEAATIPPEDLSPDQAVRLIHELQVHRIELEMQNDELRLSQSRLEESRSRYADLYDFAPVGYLTLDEPGRIVEANLTAATLLGVERGKLLNRFFPLFLVKADRRVFRQLLGNGLKRRRRGEFHLADGNGDVRVMLLDILFLTDAEGRERRRIALIDFTEIKRTQEELRLYKDELEELVSERTAELLQVNEQLREARDNFEALFKAAPLAIAEFDTEGRVTNINPAAERLYGWTLEEARGRLPLAIPPESPEESLALLERVLNGESVTGVEIKQQRKDGTIIDGSVSAGSLYDARGKLRGFVGMGEDITDRRRAEQEIRRLASFPELNPHPILEVDREGRVLYANPGARRLAGKLGLPADGRVFLPPDIKEWFDGVQNGGPREHSFDLTLQDRVFNVGVFFPHDLPTARIYAIDITRRKEAEEAQRRSEAREVARCIELLTILDTVPSAILLSWDLTGHSIIGNPAAYELLRLPMGSNTSLSAPEEARPRNFRVMQHGRELAPEELPIQRAAAHGETVRDFEVDLIFDDGVVRQVVGNAVPLLDEAGAPRGAVGAFLDITGLKQAEAALRESENRFRAFMDNSPAIAFAKDEAGRYVYVNQTFENISGISPDDCLGKPDLEIWPREDAENFRRHDLEVMGKNQAIEVIESTTTPDGERLTHWISKFPFEDAAGKRYVGGIGVDVTARLEAEAALQRAHDELEERVAARTASLKQANEDLRREIEARKEAQAALTLERQRLLDVLEILPASIFLQTPDHTVTFANRYFRERFGEPQSQPCYTLLGNQEDPCPDCSTAAVFQTGEPGDWESTGADGRTYQVYAHPFADVTGSPMVMKMGIDITRRKQAEEALRRNEAILRLVLDTLPVGVLVADREGRVVQANPAAQRIWGGARYVGPKDYGDYQGWWAVTGKSIAPGEWALARAIHKGETSLGEVINIQGFDGSRKTIINSGVPLFNDRQEILGAIAVNQDITAIIRAQEIIREQGRQLEAFFAHSLTPLVFMDRNFNFLRVNAAYAQACWREAQDLVGHNFFEFYPETESRPIFEEVVRRKAPHQVQAQPLKLPHAPEGTLNYWDWALNPILNQAGEVDFLVFSLRDVTGQVLAEQARNRFIDILEGTPDFVGIADDHGRLQYINRAGRVLIGLGEDDDLAGLRVADLHPKDVARLIAGQGCDEAIHQGSWQAELALRHRDGGEIPVSQVILAHKDASGRVEFFSTIARDISDMKAAQASIVRQTAIVSGINRIFRETLSCKTEPDLARTCLAIAETLTDSPLGFIDGLDEAGHVDVLALSEAGWNLCNLSSSRAQTHPRDLPAAGLLAKSLRDGAGVIANDPASHPDWAGVPEGHPPLTAYLGLPLRYEDKTLWLLGLGNKEGGYTPADQETLESLAPAIVEALMHHRAEAALKSSERTLRFLADQLFTAQENERKRLAVELHDELGHALLALKIHLSSIEKRMLPEQEDLKEEIRSQIDYIYEVIQEVRRLYQDLSPGDVEDLGLTRALGTLIDDFAANLPRITFQVDLAVLEGLFSLPVQTVIYRIMQEALTNIGKHADPTTVTISAQHSGGQVQFVVQDDGAGFDPHTLEASGCRRGVGLVAMAERLKMVGGSLEIHTRENQGTRLVFTVPSPPEGAQS